MITLHSLHPSQAARKVQLKSEKCSQVRFGSTVDWNGPQLSPHAQVLSNYSHQGNAGDIDEPPGEHSRRVRVVDPAEDHMKKVHSDSKVQTLLPAADKEPQTQSGGKRVQDECHHGEPALQCCKAKNIIAEYLVQ